MIELQARFDEEANIMWSNKLQEEGANVINGVPGMKVHSKLAWVKRLEDKKYNNYAYIGTGNFHEGTAPVSYTHLETKSFSFPRLAYSKTRMASSWNLSLIHIFFIPFFAAIVFSRWLK